MSEYDKNRMLEIEMPMLARKVREQQEKKEKAEINLMAAEAPQGAVGSFLPLYMLSETS